MNIGVIFIVLLFGFLLCYMLFCEPSSDMVFSSRSESELFNIQRYLEANGISTYVKNKDVRRFHGPEAYINDLDNPTLHVIDAKEYKRAMNLIQNMGQNDCA